jgi:tetratricopeptide (TPR) repeat protein
MNPLIKTLAVIPLFLSLQNPIFCHAEKIYRKDGQILEGAIVNRTKDSVWIKHGLGSVGISLDDVEKILDDDGSVSKYDLKTLADSIAACVQKKDYKKALMMSDKLLEWFPEDKRIRYLRAGLNQMTGNYKEAIADYEFLIQNNAADAKVYNDLGSIYAKQNDDKKAVELFNRSVKEDPDLIQPHNNLAELFLRSKDYTRAIEEYNAVLSLEPKNVKALYNLGVVYLDKGDYSKANEQWGKAILIDPEDHESKNALDYLSIKSESEIEN